MPACALEQEYNSINGSGPILVTLLNLNVLTLLQDDILYCISALVFNCRKSMSRSKTHSLIEFGMVHIDFSRHYSRAQS